MPDITTKRNNHMVSSNLFFSLNDDYSNWLVWFCCFIVFKATFNDISVISWQSVLFLVVETGENHRPVASH